MLQGVRRIIATNPAPPTRLINHTPEEFEALQIHMMEQVSDIICG